MHWVFFLIVAVLPAAAPPEILVSEPFMYFDSLTD